MTHSHIISLCITAQNCFTMHTRLLAAIKSLTYIESTGLNLATATLSVLNFKLSLVNIILGDFHHMHPSVRLFLPFSCFLPELALH